MLFSQYGTGSALDVLALAAAHSPIEETSPLQLQDITHASCSTASSGRCVPNTDLYARARPDFSHTRIFGSGYIGLENSTRSLHISENGSFFEKEPMNSPRVCRSTDSHWQVNSTTFGDRGPASPSSPANDYGAKGLLDQNSNSNNPGSESPLRNKAQNKIGSSSTGTLGGFPRGRPKKKFRKANQPIRDPVISHCNMAIAALAGNEQQDGLGRRRLLNSQNSPPWSPTDDVLLRELKDVRHLGWREIATYFPGRTSFGCQFRWRRLAAGLTRENNTHSAAARAALPHLNTSLHSPAKTSSYEHAIVSPTSASTTESHYFQRRMSSDSTYASMVSSASTGSTGSTGSATGGLVWGQRGVLERRSTF